MLETILILSVIAISVFAVIAARQAAEFQIVRTAKFSAPASALYELVNDLHQWDAWSPWAKLDPAAKNSFAGPSSGVGAVMSWVGNRKVGEGRMTILDSQPDQIVRFKLEFFKPFAASNIAEFSFSQAADETTVTWSMTGKNNFIGKAM